MGYITDKLKMFLYDKTSDRNEPFDLDKGITDNFEKIDMFAKNIDDNKINNSEKTTTGEEGKIPTYNEKHTLKNTGVKVEKTFTLSNNDYVKIIAVKASNLSSKLKLSWNGTSNSRVANGELNINYHHNGEPIISGNAGTYGIISFLIECDKYGSFNLYAKTADFFSDTTPIVFTLNYVECSDYDFPMLSTVVSELVFSKEFFFINGVKMLSLVTFENDVKIKKRSTSAFDITNDDNIDIFVVDTITSELKGVAVSELEIAKKVVKRNSDGKIAGLEKVTNTSDENKPVSIAQQLALDKKYNSSEMVIEKISGKGVLRDNEGNIADVFNGCGIFERKVLTIPTFNRVENENFDIIIPISTTFRGQLKVKLITDWNIGTLAGEMEKTFQLYASKNENLSLELQSSSYSSVEGVSSNYISIKNAVVQGNSLKITVVKKDQTVDVLGKVILEFDSSCTMGLEAVKNATVSSVYIADNSNEPLPVLQSRGINIKPTVIPITTATDNKIIPSGLPVGTRLLYRKINQTQGIVAIATSGSERISHKLYTSINLNSDGDFWLIEKITDTRWDIVDGRETGNNANGTYKRYANLKQECDLATLNFTGSGIGQRTALWTFPAAFNGAPSTILGAAYNYSNVQFFHGGLQDRSGTSATLLCESINSNAGNIASNVRAVGEW